MSRTYHNLTAHYNVLFNGEESLRGGLERITSAYPDDYAHLLPIYKSSDPRTADVAKSDMDFAILKGSKLIKVHSITKKPKRRKRRTEAYKRMASKTEFNRWVDDAYLLIGKAYFYEHNFLQSVKNFSYVVRNYPEDPNRFEAMLWLARSYCESERFGEASDMIIRLQSDDDFPRKKEGELALITADYHVKQGEFEEAIPFLQIAIKKTNNRKNKLRYKYILAQLYQETDDVVKATKAYRELIAMHPPYEMVFNARINIAGVFRGEGDAEKLKKELRKMLRDSKNNEFQDQIYYALANIYFQEGDKDLAIDTYRKSVAVSTNNENQRALSSITLGEIYFEDKKYQDAHAYYDSAMLVIDEIYPNYKNIKERSSALNRLVTHLDIVEKEDSLQFLAQLGESERNLLIDGWIAEINKKEREAKEREQQELADRSYYKTQSYRSAGLGQQTNSSSFYFYNSSTVTYGRGEFQRLWGKRKLEDNWRRKNKQVVSFDEDEQLADEFAQEENTNVVVRVEDPKTRDFYLQDIPLNDSLIAISNDRIKDALFHSGRIFEADFQDYDNAIKQLEELNRRFPDNVFALSSYFDLYNIYDQNNNSSKSTYYRSLIIDRYPESKFAHYLQNPDYFIELEARKDSVNRLYRKAFDLYHQKQYDQLGMLSTQIIGLNPDSVMMPKVAYMKAIADGKQQTTVELSISLQDYVNKYPMGEPRPLAEDIIRLLADSTLTDYQKLVEMGYINEEIVNTELLPENQRANDEFGGKFSYDEDMLHSFVIAYPKKMDIDVNRLKFDVANYNIDHYTKLDFDIETKSLNEQTELLVVKSLQDKEQSLIYFRSIIRKREVFKTLKDITYVNFVASSVNLREVMADKSYFEYLKYYVKNYSKFISSDFPTEELEGTAEELIAKAESDEIEEERGQFVMVTPDRDKGQGFTGDDLAKHAFVIGLYNPAFDNMGALIKTFNDYNRSKYRELNLKVSSKQYDDATMMLVEGLNDAESAMRYFRKVVADRSLFTTLGTERYRNFVVHDENLNMLTGLSDMDRYMTFFRNYYIQGKKDVAAPKKSEKSASAKEKAAEDKYEGPFKASADEAHECVIIIPAEGVERKAFVDGLKNYVAGRDLAGISVVEDVLDFRVAVRIDGFKDGISALKFLRTITREESLFKPLETVQFRNFIITDANYQVFRKEKNIKAYMDFYKKFYLSK
ncbi:tetratricopeptide repeat protein [Puteibacter caeruleilacunae]|nr:tetratricopeptide repeat protein [Puteibacter caeruleilacunae]